MLEVPFRVGMGVTLVVHCGFHRSLMTSAVVGRVTGLQKLYADKRCSGYLSFGPGRQAKAEEGGVERSDREQASAAHRLQGSHNQHCTHRVHYDMHLK